MVTAVELSLRLAVLPLVNQILALSAQIHKCANEVWESSEEHNEISQAEVNLEEIPDA